MKNRQKNKQYFPAKLLAAIGALALLASAVAAAAVWLRQHTPRLPSRRGQRGKNARGFSLAEVLIVAAIVVVLMGIGTVGVIRYQRSLTQMELDSTAKEIFITAQNNLALAKSQGYYGLSGDDFGTPVDGMDGVYYFIVSVKDGAYTSPEAASGTLLSYLLPYASVDETVRNGRTDGGSGSYIIIYNKESARVMDVFFAESAGKFAYDFTGYGDLNGMFGESNKSARRNCFGGAIIGWYGGESAQAIALTKKTLPTATVEFSNGDTLTATVHVPRQTGADKVDVGVADAYATVQLFLYGETSEHDRKVAEWNGNSYDTGLSNDKEYLYTIVLDDITDDALRFRRFCNTGDMDPYLIPGENVTLHAKVTSSNDGYEAVTTDSAWNKKTNSLFNTGSAPLSRVSGDADAALDGTALISSIRHLENLDGYYSWFLEPSHRMNYPEISGASSFAVTGKQTANLNWNNGYWNTRGYAYLPVNNDYTLNYTGAYGGSRVYSISNIPITSGADAGIFGTLSADTVTGLSLVDIKAASSERSAGALAGCAEDSHVTNVTVTVSATSASSGGSGGGGSGAAWPLSTGLYPSLWVRGLSGLIQRGEGGGGTRAAVTADIKGALNAGGLIGSMNGGSVNFCAVALLVEATGTGGAAGGLLGSVSSSADHLVYIRGCGVGAETDDAEYSEDLWNVKAAASGGKAGGLAGAASGVRITVSGSSVSTLNIECSYSDCSCYGKGKAGGFIGEVSGEGVTAKFSYCTGISTVDGLLTSKRYCFLGDGSLAADSAGNRFAASDAGRVTGTSTGVTACALVSEWTDYPDFFLGASLRQTAKHYDSALEKYNGYSFPTVLQLYIQMDDSGDTLTAALTDAGIAQSALQAAAKHLGDWCVPIPAALGYQWRNGVKDDSSSPNGDALVLKIDYSEFYSLNNSTAPKIITVAVTGETSKVTRTYTLNLSSDGTSVAVAAENGKGYIFPLTVGGSPALNSTAEIKTDDALPAPVIRDISAANHTFTLVFDDVTTAGDAGRFKTLMCSAGTGKNLIPGENITARVSTLPTWAEICTEWEGLGDSAKAQTRTNSLFAFDPDSVKTTEPTPNPVTKTGGSVTGTAYITSIRHLQNLDGSKSGYLAGETVTEVEAYQNRNLSWSGYWSGSGYDYKPVNTAYTLAYSGWYTETEDGPRKLRSITGVTAKRLGDDAGEDAGIFGALKTGDSVSGLILTDVGAQAADKTVDGNVIKGNAGALAGSSAGNVEGVLAYNSGTGTAATVTAVTGSAGGLIGDLTGGTVTECAAALAVKTTGTGDGVNACAGGLIGSASDCTVTGCYSGGHTDKGEYYSHNGGARTGALYNVTAAKGAAGGLIGSAGNSGIISCYSTCSVSGTTAGGLAGTASGSLTDCYCTGLVSGSSRAGAFVGTYGGSPSTLTGCKYYEIINETVSASGCTYLGKEGTPLTLTGVTALDADAAAYNGFIISGDARTGATNYDSSLNGAHNFDLPTLSQWGYTGGTYTDITETHYGDWPRPETWVTNPAS